MVYLTFAEEFCVFPHLRKFGTSERENRELSLLPPAASRHSSLVSPDARATYNGALVFSFTRFVTEIRFSLYAQYCLDSLVRHCNLSRPAKCLKINYSVFSSIRGRISSLRIVATLRAYLSDLIFSGRSRSFLCMISRRVRRRSCHSGVSRSCAFRAQICVKTFCSIELPCPLHGSA
jgi:hypothetical protein